MSDLHKTPSRQVIMGVKEASEYAAKISVSVSSENPNASS